jgi:hypothetical protein
MEGWQEDLFLVILPFQLTTQLDRYIFYPHMELQDILIRNELLYITN